MKRLRESVHHYLHLYHSLRQEYKAEAASSWREIREAEWCSQEDSRLFGQVKMHLPLKLSWTYELVHFKHSEPEADVKNIKKMLKEGLHFKVNHKFLGSLIPPNVWNLHKSLLDCYTLNSLESQIFSPAPKLESVSVFVANVFELLMVPANTTSQ